MVQICFVFPGRLAHKETSAAGRVMSARNKTSTDEFLQIVQREEEEDLRLEKDLETWRRWRTWRVEEDLESGDLEEEEDLRLEEDLETWRSWRTWRVETWRGWRT